ncbi:Man1-Src1p-C-terminal domain-containing protein [Crassisporium funariophilum]|nr:Man1-Src1p-C-terminal domain-containing protein [Crassisporium funariophilum]
MSRLTSAQVISLGEYLEPEFDPTSLTVSQLLGVLGFHNIRYPTPYTKVKLVQVFNAEVKTRTTKYKKDRLKTENSVASEDGITDGHTGQPLGNKGKTKAPAPVSRRSSRRLSQAPNIEETSPTRLLPPKRRRSSAQPTFGGTTRILAPSPSQATLNEESEPEEEELPLKKVSRTKKLSSAGKQARRISHASGDESGWEDNNIFQSGAESSSPVRPSPVRPRTSRPSGVLRKTRKSTSAPPQMLESSSPSRPSFLQDNSSRSPPQSPFRPSLPPIPDFSQLQRARASPFSPTGESKTKFTPALVQPEPHPTEDFEGVVEETEVPNSYQIVKKRDDESEFSQDSDSHSNDLAISRPISGDSGTVALHSPNVGGTTFTGIIARVISWLVILSVCYSVFDYKSESSAIGYCDTGSNTSLALEGLLAQRTAEELCNKDKLLRQLALLNNNTTSVEEQVAVNATCPLPPIVPLPRPSTCTPCPEHGTCTQFSVTCDPGYLLKPNILLSFIPVSPSSSVLSSKHASPIAEAFFKSISVLTDGLPGFGSVGLPPRCVEDPKRKKNIGALGKAVESALAKERGRRVCRGEHFEDSGSQDSAEEAIRWGVEVDKLRETFRQKTAPSLLPVFDDMFNEAIQQLTQWGGVFVGESTGGQRYVAHKTPEMTWDCIITVKSRELWAAWRATVLASILAIVTSLGLRIRLTQKQKESRRIASLVQVALDTLRNQELSHYVDPLTVPQPYLSSIQLRDLVLQDEHAVSIRRRLWERVERVVESNANVRANLEEIDGGDETRVWRWVGSTGMTPGRKGKETEWIDD